MRIAISDCLLGKPVRYDGGAKPCPAVLSLAEDVEVVRACPEAAAGLPVPRPPAEQRDGGVFLADGTDVTEAFAYGSGRCLAHVLAAGVLCAVLKARSPSCGAGEIYDGSHTGALVPGWGVFAARLRAAGIAVFTEEDVISAQPDPERPWALLVGSDGGRFAALPPEAPVMVIPQVSPRSFAAACARAQARGCGVWISNVAGCPRSSNPFISALMRGLAGDPRPEPARAEDLSGYSLVALVREVLRLL